MDHEHKGSVNNNFQMDLPMFYGSGHDTTGITNQVKNE